MGESQWNPRRSRGARCHARKYRHGTHRLSGTPAEAGVRGVPTQHGCQGRTSLSGTPAEAGVRDDDFAIGKGKNRVSVEPPPKQGCEVYVLRRIYLRHCLSGTPAEAGVRAGPQRRSGYGPRVSVEPPPKQGCETVERGARNWFLTVPVEPPPKQGCELYLLIPCF